MRGYDKSTISSIPAPLALPIFVAMYECRDQCYKTFGMAS